MQVTPYHTTLLPNIPSWRILDGWFNFTDFYASVARQLAMIQDEVTAVEVGSWKGQSAAFFCEQLKYHNAKHVKFYAVDTWKGSPTEKEHQTEVEAAGGDLFPVWQKNMEECGVIDWVTPLQMTSVEASKRFADKSVDFVFLDGDHRYPFVKEDISVWLPKIRPGGCIAGHDYDWREVKKAVDELLGGRVKTWGNCWIVENC